NRARISSSTAVSHSTAIDHRQWYSTPATPDPPRSSAGENAMDVTTTSKAMVIAQTTMQYGHTAPIRYRLWKISQCTNTAPATTPTHNPIQYHCGRTTLTTASTPVTSTTVKPMMPSSGLGK